MAYDRCYSFPGCGFAGALPKYQLKRLAFVDTYSAFPTGGDNLVHGML